MVCSSRTSSFTAQLANRDVILNWTTATELNNQGFEIEYSIDNQTLIKSDLFLALVLPLK